MSALVTNQAYTVHGPVLCSRMQAIDRGLYKLRPHFHLWKGRWQCIGWQSWTGFDLRRVSMLMVGDGATPAEAFENWNFARYSQ